MLRGSANSHLRQKRLDCSHAPLGSGTVQWRITEIICPVNAEMVADQSHDGTSLVACRAVPKDLTASLDLTQPAAKASQKGVLVKLQSGQWLC